MNFNRSQQQEPTESSPRKAWELVGIPVIYGGEDVKNEVKLKYIYSKEKQEQKSEYVKKVERQLSLLKNK